MAFVLDASSDSIQLADNAALTFSGDWTVSVFLLVTGTQAYGQRVFASNDGGLTNYIEATITASETVDFFSEDAEGDNISVTTTAVPFPSSSWVHLVWRRSGDTVQIFVNGTADSSTTDATYDSVDLVAPMYFR